MKIRPLHDRIVAKRPAEEAKTSGGLFIRHGQGRAARGARHRPTPAREVVFGNEARRQIGVGLNILANTGKVKLGSLA